MAMNADTVGAKVLVTGGAGFIGSHIVDALLMAGHEVTVIDDLSSGSLDQIPASVTFIQCDVADRLVSDHIRVAQPDLVIHAAAQVSVNASVEDSERDRRVNLAGTENVLRGAREAGARRFVFISSGGAVYGEAEGSTEADVPNPANPYGIHKLAAEGYVRSSGLQYAIARFANVYGPRQRSDLEGGVVSIFIERLTTWCTHHHLRQRRSGARLRVCVRRRRCDAGHRAIGPGWHMECVDGGTNVSTDTAH